MRIAFTPDSARVYVPVVCGGERGQGLLNVVDVASRTIIATIRPGGNPYAAALTADGRRAYVALGGIGGVAEIDTTTNRILDTFGVVGPAQSARTADIAITETAPPLQPGQRFTPGPPDPFLCQI